jgi:hypothetical protein
VERETVAGTLNTSLNEKMGREAANSYVARPSSYEEQMVIRANRYMSNLEKEKINKHLATGILTDAETKAVGKRTKPV